MARLNAADQTRAMELFTRSIELETTFTSAYSALAAMILREGVQFFIRPAREAADTASSWVRKAIEINADDSEAWATLASATLHGGNLREALEHASMALSLNPNSCWANGVKGGILIDSDHPTEGRDLLLSALRLSPRDPRNAIVLSQICRSYYYERDYEHAGKAGFSTVARYPNHPTAYCWLAAALGQLGMSREAGDALQKARATSPESLNRYVQGDLPFLRAENREHLLDGLRKAGWRG
jgi:tetratricopeptide (TPR) repeat protein